MPTKPELWSKEKYDEVAERLLKKIRSDPEGKKSWVRETTLSGLTPKERGDYDVLMGTGRYKRNEALELIGRSDLIVLR